MQSIQTLLLRGGCSPPITGEPGGGEYPKGEVVAKNKRLVISLLYIPTTPSLRATPPPGRRGEFEYSAF